MTTGTEALAPTASTAAPDPRRHAYRSDLAASALRHLVKAPRYVDGAPGRIVRASVPVRSAPDVTRGLATEALFGEQVTVFDEADGWAWVQLQRDRYVGYVSAEAIGKPAPPATHRVQTLGTFVYPQPDIKSPPMLLLPMNALLTVRRSDDRFAELEHGGYVFSRHLVPVERFARDYIEIAERFVGSPYLWGGRTRVGIDCSGLVQTALHAAGIPAPRDSDMQRDELGHPVEVRQGFEGLQRGDLVFWPGHVAIMVDSVMMVHANAHHMMVAVEPLPEAATRIAKTGSSPVLAIKRLAASA